MSERRVEDYPIKFGPLWLRTFSREGSAGASGGAGGSGGTSTGAPPSSASNRPQPQPTKYKLAQYRYGREEMLALYENDLDPPAGLQAFEPLYVPDHQRPLALTTDAVEDEPREHARNVGLNRNAGVAGSGGGPPSMERFGRGLSDLSRGRGRPHQPYSLTSSERVGSYREENPYGEPPAPGLTRSWSSGSNAPLGRTASDNTDWNQNRPYKSRWPEPNWRSQTGRAYGEENEPARRVLVPLGRPRQPIDKRDKEKSDRPTSWAASRRAWTGEQHFSEDNLPEWATEGDTEASGGTFDSSGAFHDVDATTRRPPGESFYGLARSHTQGSIGTRSRSHDEENPVASEPPQGWWNSDKGSEAPPKKFDATNIKFKKPPPASEETSGSDKNESSFETSDDQFEKAVAKAKHLKIDDHQSDPKKKMVSFSEEKFGQSKTFDALMRIQADEAMDERGNFNSTLMTTNNSLRQKHQDSVTQPQPVPAQPEPPQPERKILPEINPNRLPKPEDIGTKPQGVSARSRGLDAFSAFGLPSMPIDVASNQGAFQPYTEPSPHNLNDASPYNSGVDTQDMLKKAALQMVNDSNTWYYEDPQKNVQGPFTPSEMRQWYRAGFFSPDLMIRRACDKEMRSLGSFGEIPPFAENVSELLAFLTRKIMMTENDGQEKPDLQQVDPLQHQKTQLQHPQLPQSHINQSNLQQTAQLQQLLLSQQQPQIPQSPMPPNQMPQSQMLHSLLQESHRQQLQLQQSQLLQLQLQQSQIQQSQLQQSQLQQSQLDQTPVQQSFLQQPQMPQTQIHQSHLHQPQLHPSQLQQSQLQNPLLPQTPLHQASLQPSLLSQPQLPQTSMHQSQLPTSKLNQMPLPQPSLQDILMNKTTLQPQPAQWSTSHPFASPAMLATNVAAPPTPVMTFGNRTHSTFLEQLIQPQRAPAPPVPESPLPEVTSKPESVHREVSPAPPPTAHSFSFLSRPPPPISSRAQPDVSEHPPRAPVASDTTESASVYLDESALYKAPEAPFESAKAPAVREEPKESAIKKVDPEPEKEREPVGIKQPSPLTVEPKQQKSSTESKEKPTKTKESKTKSKSSKTKERQDESGDRKTERQDSSQNETKVEEMPGFTKVVNKKEEKQSKKEKKEAIQEIPAATKASQRKNADKKKSEEVKATEEAERRRKEELQRYRIVEDLKEEAFFINNLEKKYIKMEEQLLKAREQRNANTSATVTAPASASASASAAAANKKAPWSAPSPAAPAANNEGLTLAEIQKLEREKKFETIKEQQQMMQLIAQQQQAALAREQEIQQTTGYNWAKYKPNRNNDNESVQSLAEIQEETRRRQMLEIARQEATAPPPAAAAASAAANQTPWANGALASGSAYLGGFWESSPGALGRPEEKVASPRRGGGGGGGEPQPQPTKSKKANKAHASPAKEPKKTSPTADFDSWCLKVLGAWSSKIDVPIFVSFLKDIESAYEVKDYVKSYLGETKESTDFARNFLEKRSKLLRGAQSECVDDLSAPAAAKNPVSGAAADFQELKGKGKKVKKNKMLKVDTRILGFSVTAAENRINVGDIESL